MFVHYSFSSVSVAEWQPFMEIAPHSVGHMFSLSFVYLYFLFISHIGFNSGILAFYFSSFCSLLFYYFKC